VAVLPYDAERKTALLVRLLRNGPLVAGDGEPVLLEAPAGMLDGAPEDVARREAMEEAGVRLDALEPLGAPYASAGVSTERIDLFLAPYAAADRIAEGGGLAVEHEDIEVVETPLAELARMIDAGEVRDLKTLALGLALRLRRPELFA
jgi:nudix-type nucleoside diphosphatase (YffH/AdpP family)